jgi:hypothetical protein
MLSCLLQGNFTFPAEMIVALIEFLTAVWLSLYMGWAVHSLRLIPRFTNTLLACCGKKYQDVYYEDEHEHDAAKGLDEQGNKRRKSYALRASAKALVQQYYYMTQASLNLNSQSHVPLAAACTVCSALCIRFFKV